MGAIGGLFGFGGGASGTGFSGPGAAPIMGQTNSGQINDAYTNNQNALASQQALLAALQGQGGLGNQSQVYNQFQNVAAGNGPNPAQSMLNNATGTNVANQAALMAGQRGANANVGLMARQIAQQGSQTQQNAAGQAAALQAQQQLNALGAAGNLANTQAGQLVNATGMNTQAQQNEQALIQQAAAQQNNSNVAMQSNINTVNAGLAGKSMDGQQKIIGGIGQGIGAAFGMADGGIVASAPAGPMSLVGRFMTGAAPMMAQGGDVGSAMKAGGSVPGNATVSGNSFQNDKIKALLSPGEGVIDRETMQDKGPAGAAARALMAIVEAKKRSKK